MVKAIVLGCGYGCGPEKFSMISKMNLTEAEGAVNLYRTKMKKVVGLWRTYNENMGLSKQQEDEFSIQLPSGRSLNYGHLQAVPHKGRIQYVAMMNKHSKKMPVKVYGGLLAENASQALARDVFCDMLCRIHDAGLKIIFHVHDEVVLEVPEETANVDLQRVIEIMSTPPDWIPDIPLSAEGSILTKYTK
jgi:DNA polymerase